MYRASRRARLLWPADTPVLAAAGHWPLATHSNRGGPAIGKVSEEGANPWGGYSFLCFRLSRVDDGDGELPWYGWRSGPVMAPSLATDGRVLLLCRPSSPIPSALKGRWGPIAVLGQISISPFSFLLCLIWSRNGGEAERGPDKGGK